MTSGLIRGWICLTVFTLLLHSAWSEGLTVPYAETLPKIDGNLSDPVWQSTARSLSLVPALGAEEEAEDLPETRVWVLWSKEALYVAFRCEDSDIRMAPDLPRDGNIYEFDVVEVFLDPDGSADPVYEIVVSPLNQILDAVHLLSAPPELDEKGKMTDAFLKRHFWSFRSRDFDGLQTATQRDDKGWQVEITVPAEVILRKMGRDTFRAGDSIRANFLRYDWRATGSDNMHLLQLNWRPVLTGCPHISPGQMGILKLRKEHE